MQKDKSVQLPFSTSLVTTSAATQINVQPAGLGSRVLSVADGYEFYKVKKLEFRLEPATTGATASRTGTQAACFIAGITDVAPGNYQLASEVVEHVLLANAQTTPSEWCRVPKSILSGYMPWYKTIVGTPDASVELQGVIYIINGGADSCQVHVRGVISFKAGVPTSSTPMVRQLAEMRREKDRLLKILAVSPAATNPGESSKPGSLLKQ